MQSKYLKLWVSGVFVDLLGCSYNPHKEKIASHLNNLITALENFCTAYENIILLGDFNVEVEEKNMSEFMSVYSLRNLVKQKACSKNFIIYRSYSHQLPTRFSK